LKRFVASVALVIAGMSSSVSTAWSQSTATVPPDDPVYEFIDRLVAARLVDSAIVAQRPMSRLAIGRLLQSAANPPETSNWMIETLARYRRVYPADSSAARIGITSYGAELTLTDSPPRGIPSDANGSIDVVVNPLLANRMGEPGVDGAGASAWLGVELPVRKWLTFAATGRASELRPRGSGNTEAFNADQLYLRGVFRNVGVELGRDHVFFGQSNSSLVNSLDPRGFDMLRIASERPYLLPSLLRIAGQIATSVYLADLGRHQNFPHARLFGYALSIRPLSAVELGLGVNDIIGGQGAPGGTFLQKVEDVIPVIDATILHRTLLFSNKIVTGNARVLVPGVKGMQLYMEGAFDDFDLRRLKSSLTEDGGWIWGTSFECFRQCGPVRVTGEYHVTGLRYYTHGAFTSGYTLDGRFIGDQLGPRGKAGYLSIDLDDVGYHLRVDLAHEVRSGDKFGSVSTTDDDSDFHFVILEHNPAERRWRSVVSFTSGSPADAVSLRLSAGVERVEHFGFAPGSWRTNGLGRIGLEIRPGNWGILH
jgi:hypothetical protein